MTHEDELDHYRTGIERRRTPRIESVGRRAKDKRRSPSVSLDFLMTIAALVVLGFIILSV